MSSRLLLTAFLLLGLTACQGADDADTSAEAPATEEAAPAEAPTPQIALNLSGEGLQVVVLQNASTRDINFGASSSQLLTVVETNFGPAAEDMMNDECGLRVMRWDSGLTLYFSDDAFAGWSARDTDGSLTTMAGIGPGSTRAELSDALAAEFQDSSVGPMFMAGGLNGTLTGDTDEDTVDVLFAGSTCVAT
ncbi:MAG: hypothetical protein JJ896_00785 [Rhodothermales bacterium]|nr:hypothetical protein [Rhodothermales bacterium]MBO6778163.1 hypothetical protein [Rhodothermales bacterium]